MTALEQVASLKNQAIELLLNEREKIEKELTQLGYAEKARICKKCGQQGHNARTCPVPRE